MESNRRKLWELINRPETWAYAVPRIPDMKQKPEERKGLEWEKEGEG